MKKAIFFDRDGVLIEDSHLITSMSQVKLIAGAASLISYCREKGFLTFIVTNQTVVARGLISFDQAVRLNNQILLGIRSREKNAIFDKTYICPHHPNANILEYKVSCECRKPKSGMILQAQREFDIDLDQSWIIGDRLTDVYAGRAVGLKAILLKSDVQKEKLIESDLVLDSDFLNPTIVFDNLSQVKTVF